MSFSATNNTADSLEVQGALTLNGDLELVGDYPIPSGIWFDFFASTGANANIGGAFGSISDNFGANPTDSVVNVNAQLKYLRITW